MERLQKVIANAGYASRRKAEELIRSGHVKVNGNTILEMGYKVDSKDTIEIDGKALASSSNKIYVLLNKPRSVVTTTNDNLGRKTVLDLIDIEERIYPVGRLDYDTTGVLLLTNDGELTNLLIHPSNNIEKVYVAKIEGIISKEELIKLCKGVVIDGRKTAKADAKIEKIDKKNNVSYVKLIIHEGKYHQVKKMFESIGYNVIKLKRENFAFLNLNGLKSGEYRYLTTHEVKKLYGLCNKKQH